MNTSPTVESAFTSSHDLEIAQAREYYVVQHNDLVQKQRFTMDTPGNSLSVTEEKIFAYIISQIKPGATALEPIILDIKTFCEVCGLARGRTANYYLFVKNAIKKLADRSWWYTDPETDEESLIRYIEDPVIKRGNLEKHTKGSGKVVIQIHKKLSRYLLDLTGDYFQFSYHNILAMKSKYGIRLYKLLKSYYYMHPRLKFSIDDLKMHLDATSYKEFKRFKEKVLIPALRDINTYSDLVVTVEYVKTGRNYTHIVFSMKDLEKAQTPEAIEEAQRRYLNTEREIDPDQLVIDGYLGGML